jgi:hypothetical protein
MSGVPIKTHERDLGISGLSINGIKNNFYPLQKNTIELDDNFFLVGIDIKKHEFWDISADEY